MKREEDQENIKEENNKMKKYNKNSKANIIASDFSKGRVDAGIITGLCLILFVRNLKH